MVRGGHACRRANNGAQLAAPCAQGIKAATPRLTSAGGLMLMFMEMIYQDSDEHHTCSARPVAATLAGGPTAARSLTEPKGRVCNAATPRLTSAAASFRL